MAKKDAYYFSHDCNAQDDPKCMMLIDDLGMEGYGIFWALIEKLRAEKDYTLPVSICGRFARRWATSEAKIQAVVLQYGLFEIDNEVFFSLRLKRSMEERSSKARISAESRWGKNQQLIDKNQCERIAIACDRNADDMRSNAIKGKESKEKEIKINEIENNTADKSASRVKFSVPTVEMISEYCKERNNNVNARSFFDYYESKGWLVGKVKMKDWKASVRTWEHNGFSNSNKQVQQQPAFKLGAKY